ncbi:MAG: pilus assembly protein PilM [Thermoguttaceae bacterium]|jgi:type IV pilus assembly protein PilM|nr:pilus assembly protein PilM [Thermoguttaceae bacterium]
MVSLLTRSRTSPIGVHIGSRSVKLIQFDAAGTSVMDAVRWDFAGEADQEDDGVLAEAIERAREGRGFRGRRAVFCLGARDLFVQNLRVNQAAGDELRRIVRCEAAGRLPFPSQDAELRFVEAADVRQGGAARREVIVLACHRSVIARLLAVAERCRLNPVAIDVEPGALLRCYAKQYRRDDDQQQQRMFVHIGGAMTAVVIARGTHTMFVKYIDCGGRRLDEAVARYLRMPPADAAALRRHNGDRRVDQRDPEVTRSIAEALRPSLDQLAGELSMCVRYYSVTFRGQPISQVVLSGGEASDTLLEWLGARLGLPCELGNPLRSFSPTAIAGRMGQWDVAAGLALKGMN